MRYMRVQVSTELLMGILTEGSILICKIRKGLPEGAKFCYFIPSTSYIYADFVFEHPTFKVLMMGEEIPIFDKIEVEDLRPDIWEIKKQVEIAEDAYGGIVDKDYWKDLIGIKWDME